MIPTRRSARPSSPLAGLALVAAIAVALPAFAAQVVTVRAGSHSKFTRMVFELDGPAGYSVEKVGTARAPMLRVTVEAGSRFHRLRQTGDIKDVKVLAGTRAVATIALSRADLRVQEMILSNPHRIVLDLYPPGTAYASEPAPVKPAPVAKTKPAPAPKPIAKAEPPPPPAPRAEPAPEPVRKIAKPLVPKPDAEKPAPAPQPPAEEPAPAPKPLAKSEPSVGSTPAVSPAIQPKAATSPKPSDAPAALRPRKLAERPKPKLNPVKPAKPAAAETAPTAPSPGWLERLTTDMIVPGAVALGVLVVLALVFVGLRRRRALPNDLDVAAIAEEVEDAGRVLADGFAMDDAFGDESRDTGSSLGSRFTESEKARASAASAPAEEPHPATDPMPEPAVAATRGSDPSDSFDPDSIFANTDGLVGEEAREGEAPMNQDMDLPVEPTSGPPPVMGGAAAPSTEVMRMLRDFERRIQALEAKLDESNEAREKLERQVAAQSEELRVQRAAIARTQRALRTMSRADEDKATEPAVRDGDTQAKTRVNV